jgi:hypothetical protein
MRSALLATLALAIATPAFAADSASGTGEMQAIAEKLNDPTTQQAISTGLGTMIAALLDMRIDGIAKALEPMNGGKKIKIQGGTIREMATRKDKHFEEKLQKGTQAMVGGMGGMATAMADIMPQLEAAMEKMDNVMDKAADKLPATNASKEF